MPASQQIEALPLVLLLPPNGVLATTISALDRVSIPWREAYTGESCLALAAAVEAGVGIVPLGRLTAKGLAPTPKRGALPGSPDLVRAAGLHAGCKHTRVADTLAAGVRKLAAFLSRYAATPP